MKGAGRHLLELNLTTSYSPVVLNETWPSLVRMMFLFSATALGSLINGCFLGSFFLQKSLRTLGNVYLACIGLADLIITGTVLSTASFVLISGKYTKIDSICRILQFLCQASTYMYSLLFAMVAMENFIRLYHSREIYKMFLSLHVAAVSFFIILISFVTSGFGVYYELDYNYCTRKSYGNYTFRFITSLLFYGIPFVWTVLSLFFTSLVLRARAIRLIRYKRSKQYERDYAFTNLNLGCYCFFVIAWLPYFVIVNKYPNASDCHYYNSAWLGLLRSIITSFIYTCLNSSFRRGFSQIYNYFCCKSNINSLKAPSNHRHRRAIVQECTYKRGDVKVHILHNSLALSPLRRGNCTACEI